MKELINIESTSDHGMCISNNVSYILHLVTSKLTPTQSCVMEALIDCYVPSVGAWLEVEPELFEMFLSLLTLSASLVSCGEPPVLLALQRVQPYRNYQHYVML